MRRAFIAMLAMVMLAGGTAALARPPVSQVGTGSQPCMNGSGAQDGWVTYSPTSLWPPNHKLVTINISYNDGVTSSNSVPNSSSDGDGSMKTVAVSNVMISPPDGVGAGNPNGVDVGAPGSMGMATDPSPANTSEQVASERQGPSKAGRTYTINVTCTDSDNNFMGTASLRVTVPHDQGRG